MTCQINLAEFLDYPTTLPHLMYVNIEHVEGEPVEAHIPVSLLARIKDYGALVEHIEWACKNNYESYKAQVA